MSELNSSSESSDDRSLPPEVDELRIEAIVERFLEDLRSEVPVDRAALEAQFPELAPHLGRRLRFVEEVARAAAAESSAPSAVRPENAEGAEASEPTLTLTAVDKDVATNERSHRLRCPHCGNAVQLVTLDAVEVTCRECGSTFRLDSGRTWVFGQSPRPRKIGPYEIRDVVGRGAFGVVYRGYDPALSREVAIKVPRLGYFDSDDERQRFFREARSAARLRHAHIVRIYEIDQEGGTPYIVSELIDGRTLDDWCGAQRLPFREAVQLVEKVAEALDYAHSEGIVHRDVKPSNILLSATRQPYLTDFGLARRDEGEITMTLDGEILGTPAYMSPEQAEGRHQDVDARSDVFSIGVVFYRLLTGELPFRGNRRMTINHVVHSDPAAPRAVNDRIPRDLETITLKAMAKEPARRYSSARALADDLRRWLVGDPILARPESQLEKARRWCRRNPWIAGLATALVLVLATASVGGVAWAWHASVLGDEARQAERREAVARKDAEERAVETRRSLAQSLVQRAGRDLDLNPAHALVLTHAAWHVDGQDSPRDAAHRMRVGLLLQNAPQPLQVWAASAPLLTIATSADGGHVAAAARDGTATVWETRAGRRIARLTHGPTLFAIALSPDGQWLVTAGRDHLVRLWDVAAARAIEPPLQHDDWVRRVLFSPDGRWFATACHHGTLRLWHADGGRAATVPLPAQPAGILDLAFSPDSRRLACSYGPKVDEPGAARIWDLTTGEPVGPALTHERAVLRIQFSPDGKLLATAGDDGRVRLWNAETGEPTGGPDEMRHAASAIALQFTADGQRLITAGTDQIVQVWNVAQRQADQAGWRIDFVPTLLALSPDGETIALGGHGQRIEVRELRTGLRTTPNLFHAHPLTGLQFLPSGPYLLTAASDGVVKLFDAHRLSAPWPRWTHSAPIRGASLVDGDSTIVVGIQDGKIQQLDRLALRPVSGSSPPMNDIFALLASRSSDLVVVVDSSGQLRLIHRSSTAAPTDVTELSARIDRFDLHQASERVLAVSLDGTATVWDGKTGQLVSSTNLGQRMYSASFAPDGQWFAAGGTSVADQGQGPGVWDVLSGQRIAGPLDHPGIIYSVAFQPGGQLLATAGSDHTVRLWELPSGREVGRLPHEDDILRVAFDASGRLLTGTCGNGMAVVWDVDHRRPHCRPLHHAANYVHGAVFHPSATILATAAQHFEPLLPGQAAAEVRLWEVATGDPIGPAIPLAGAVSALRFTDDGNTLVIASHDGSVRAIPLRFPELSSELAGPLVERATGLRYDESLSGPYPLTADEQAGRANDAGR